MMLEKYQLINKSLFQKITSKKKLLLSTLTQPEFQKNNFFSFAKTLEREIDSQNLYSESSPLNLIAAHTQNLYFRNVVFEEFLTGCERNFENYAFSEAFGSFCIKLVSLAQISPNRKKSEITAPDRKNSDLSEIQNGLETASEMQNFIYPATPILHKMILRLSSIEFKKFSLMDVNEFKFSLSDQRRFWIFENSFSILTILSKTSLTASHSLIKLFFSHFDLLFKVFQDVYLILNFPLIKVFQPKPAHKTQKSGFTSFIRTFQNIMKKEPEISSENELFLKHKHRGNILSINKNAHLLRNLITGGAESASALGNLLDGLQFFLFGVSSPALLGEVVRMGVGNGDRIGGLVGYLKGRVRVYFELRVFIF